MSVYIVYQCYKKKKKHFKVINTAYEFSKLSICYTTNNCLQKIYRFLVTIITLRKYKNSKKYINLKVKIIYMTIFYLYDFLVEIKCILLKLFSCLWTTLKEVV